MLCRRASPAPPSGLALGRGGDACSPLVPKPQEDTGERPGHGWTYKSQEGAHRHQLERHNGRWGGKPVSQDGLLNPPVPLSAETSGPQPLPLVLVNSPVLKLQHTEKPPSPFVLQAALRLQDRCVAGRRALEGDWAAAVAAAAAMATLAASPSIRACLQHGLYPGLLLLGWVQTRFALTPQPAGKLLQTKGPGCPSPADKPRNKWNRAGVTKEPAAHQPLNPFTYLRAYSRERWGPALWKAGCHGGRPFVSPA